jgi:hypothetical protein
MNAGADEMSIISIGIAQESYYNEQGATAQE